MSRRSIIYSEQQHFLHLPPIVGQQLVHKKVNLLTYYIKSAEVALQCSDAGALELVQHFYQSFFRL